MTKFIGTFMLLPLLAISAAQAELPAPPVGLAPWSMLWGQDIPGEMSAAPLLERPAGARGPICVRSGHFFSGGRRVRFLGASIAFSGAFPTHVQADHIASRLAHFGINAIRFHHMDFFPWPNGIFADATMEKLSPAAMDRLDYFVAALKSQGVYSDLNLHVSRSWSRAHHWPHADELPELDKMVDLFNPDLIAADKQYARDLLLHVNAYTHVSYAHEPAVCFVEINNENTLFLWGGEEKLASLPEPYAGQLQKLYNDWLLKKYGSRDALKTAWSVGTQPARAELLRDRDFAQIGNAQGWDLEQHDTAGMTASAEKSPAGAAGVVIKVDSVDGTNWHLQFNQAGLAVKKGHYYSLNFDGSADQAAEITAAVNQAHQPWNQLGLSDTVKLEPTKRTIHLGFVADADDDNARVSFLLGEKPSTFHLSGISLHEGGQLVLSADEDPARGTVRRGNANGTHARSRDWYDFLQQTDEAYFVGMSRFLKEELGVQCPITGTIGLGPLGTESQSTMDFVDAHAYWDHPEFPHRSWDMRDWTIRNKPMVDDPTGATLWELAATRVAGKPFTVTEYNHAAPNEWQAECVPMIASFAAAQDWDGVFLFDYVGDDQYERTHTTGYFDIEGNPLKMATIPLAARLFIGGAVPPFARRHVVAPTRDVMLNTASRFYFTLWPFVHDTQQVDWPIPLREQLSIQFENDNTVATPGNAPEPGIAWTSSGPDSGTGRYVVAAPGAFVFAGFASGEFPIRAGSVSIEKLETPFATIMVAPADPSKEIASADRLLVCAIARGSNSGMKWDAARRTVSMRWGNAPSLVEIVHATLAITGDRPLAAFALTPEGTRGASVPVTVQGNRTLVHLGERSTLWYELERK